MMMKAVFNISVLEKRGEDRERQREKDIEGYRERDRVNENR